MQTSKKTFEESIIQLCKTLSSEEVEQLDDILTQEKDDLSILKEIVATFPNFRNIYVAKLAISL